MDSLAIWLQAGLRNCDSLWTPVSITPTQSHNCGMSKALKSNDRRSQEPRLADTRDAGPIARPAGGRSPGRSPPPRNARAAGRDRPRLRPRRDRPQNTNRAYAADWRDYLRWRARQGLDLQPLADPECVGLYLAALASGAKGAGGRARTVGTIERRLSALSWNFAQRALPFDRKDRHVATVLAGVRRTHGRPPVQKEALLPEHVIAMLDAPAAVEPPKHPRPGDPFPRLRRRPAPLGDRRPRHEPRRNRCEGSGWPEFFDDGVLLTLRGKNGWREVEIGRGSLGRTCPVAALETWPK